MPRVSVVILSHRPAMLRQALDSVLAQTEPGVQIVVQYCSEAWPTKLNEAVNATTGTYVVILCDDDLLHPAYLERCLLVAEQGADITYTDRRVFRSEPPERGFHFRMHGDQFRGPEFYWMEMDPEGFRFGSSLPMTCMIRRTWWDRMGGHDTLMPHSDTEFWYRSVVNGAKCGYLPEPLFWYREHADQITRKNDQMMEFLHAFHRKHFLAFGVLMETAVEIGHHKMDVKILESQRLPAAIQRWGAA